MTAEPLIHRVPGAVASWLIAVALAVAAVPAEAFALDAGQARAGAARVAATGDLPAESHVVVFRRGVGNPGMATERLERSVGFTASDRYSAALSGFAAVLTTLQVQRLEGDPAVAHVVPDEDVSAAARKPAGGAAEALPVGIERIGALQPPSGLGPAGSAVAVLDTGLDLDNPDLDAVAGVNCVKKARSSQDDNGHGTHVAGTIGAREDGGGAIGVAPGTRLYAVKVLDRHSRGKLSGLLCGMDWVQANARHLGIRVANLSLTAPGADDGACGALAGDPLHLAVCSAADAGILYVSAAGNDGADLAQTVPAAYPENLAVTAMTDTDGVPGALGAAACVAEETDDRSATYSNHAASEAGAAHVVSAPGTCVVSTGNGGGTATMLGTSMAAPHAAATAALCIGRPGSPGPCAGLPVSAVIDRLRADAADAALAGRGFTGDLLSPLSARHMGPLVSASGY